MYVLVYICIEYYNCNYLMAYMNNKSQTIIMIFNLYNILSMKYTISLILILFVSFNLVGQKQANFWFFGNHAGLDFSQGSPSPITTGSLSTMEGCSAIASETGLLQFYTDGSDVWNRTNAVMPNGSGLNGNSSSTQSAIIVPKPGSTSLYYIFTVDEATPSGGSNGLQYSLVDMTLNGWKGDIVTSEKNVLLTAPLCEKVTAVGHANGTDTWVIAPKWGTNSFYAYLVTSSGVNDVPVISSVGDLITGGVNNFKGYLKVSPDGSKLAKANAGMGTIEIFDFNNSNGIVSNVLKDYVNGTDPYGVEFSPNSELLYIGSWYIGAKYLYQYNLAAGSPQEILDSRLLIATGTNGALQLGPDNRIYAAQNQSSNISVINEPNKIGTDCNFQWGVISLGGQNCRWGLPPFIQSFFSFNASFFNTTPCFGEPTQFTQNSSQEPDSVYWNFGNSSSGSLNFSTEFNPVHLFTSPGFFSVNLTVWISEVEVSVTHMVIVNEMPVVTLPNDTAMCDGNLYTINAGEGFHSYLWQNGETTDSITVNSTGTYWVEVQTEEGCADRDTVDVIFYENPTSDAGPTQNIMQGDVATLQGEVSGGSGNYTIDWQPSEFLVQNNIITPQTLVLASPKFFTLNIEDDNGCVAEPDEVLVNIDGAFLSATPSATAYALCVGESTTITANAIGGSEPYQYEWTSEPAGYTFSDSEFTVTPDIGNTKFNLTVTDNLLNTANSSIDIIVHPNPEVNLIPIGVPAGDTIVVCVRDSVQLDAGNNTDPEGTIYYWENLLLENRYYTATTNGNWIDFQTHNVEVTYVFDEKQCSSTGGVTIMFDYNECSIGIPEEEIANNRIKFINLFPNPNDGNFTLKLKHKATNINAKVFDVSGRMIFKNDWEGSYNIGETFFIPLEKNSNGIYFVHITANEFNTVLKMFVR